MAVFEPLGNEPSELSTATFHSSPIQPRRCFVTRTVKAQLRPDPASALHPANDALRYAWHRLNREPVTNSISIASSDAQLYLARHPSELQACAEALKLFGARMRCFEAEAFRSLESLLVSWHRETTCIRQSTTEPYGPGTVKRIAYGLRNCRYLDYHLRCLVPYWNQRWRRYLLFDVALRVSLAARQSCGNTKHNPHGTFLSSGVHPS